MNVMVIAPHPDDESIGCGGLLRQHALRNDRVVAVFLTSGEHALKHLPREQAWPIREGEAEAAAQVLGVSQLEFLRSPDWFLAGHIEQTIPKVQSLLERERPHVVLLPHPQDAHPDHVAAQEIYARAASGTEGFAPVLLAYEIWTPIARYNHLLDITLTIQDKLRAVRCYKSQLKSFKYDQAVRGLNRYRGALHTQWRFAEAYENLGAAAGGLVATGLVTGTADES
jgi:N-acetylglucosamine malate deacetylase 1